MGRQKIALLLMAAALTVSAAESAMAAGWQVKRLDTDGDGLQEVHWFDQDGNMIPYGYTLKVDTRNADSLGTHTNWKADLSGGKVRWWYDNGGGGRTANGWQWIDGDGNGVSECYYFDGSGYLLTGARTPDGYTVSWDGMWLENGMVQTRGIRVGSEIPGRAIENPPSSEEIVSRLEKNKDSRFDHIYLSVDSSKSPVSSGATNVKIGNSSIRNCWTWHEISGEAMCALAFDENGYLLVNTTTPDGYYVNQYGLLEIQGAEVLHGQCRSFPWMLQLLDKEGALVANRNYCDLSRIDLEAASHRFTDDLYYAIPFGMLVYTHCENTAVSPPSSEQGYGSCVLR